MAKLQIFSTLTSSWEDVWAHVLSLGSINHEMLPVFKMTGPEQANLLELAQQKPFGEPIFTSTVLLGGWLPAERMQVTVSEGGVTDSLGWFVEQSPMRLMKSWRHERRLERLAVGCRISDSLEFATRVPGATALIAPGLEAFFAHRHRWLQRRFGRLVDPRPWQG